MDLMRKALVIAPHADDETLGMGGTIARLSAEGWSVTVAVMTGHGEVKHPIWPRETWDRVRAEAVKACQVLGAAELSFEELPASCLDLHPTHKTNEAVARLLAQIEPEAVYIPFVHDLHRDHYAIAYAAQVALRPFRTPYVKMLTMYETPTETHLRPGEAAMSFVPNEFVDITDYFETKLSAWAQYESQQLAGFSPRSPEALAALAGFRGAYIGTRYAEAFQLLFRRS
jgi:LmbE family N-acetylglucosaminyl deacetylase